MTLDSAVTEMMSRESVVVGVDFDGTLAPIVAHPDLAVPDARAVAAVVELASRPGVTVAIVSGRARDDLAIRLGPAPGVTLIGEHGNDDGGAPADPTELQEARRLIERLEREYPEATVEIKPHSVSFHTRALAPGDRHAARSAIEGWAVGRHGLHVLEGKDVVELTTGARSKGDAIDDLAEGSDGIVYMGDDVTDETVFDRLGPGDIGIKVGDGETAAAYRVAGVPEVLVVLESMALASR